MVCKISIIKMILWGIAFILLGIGLVLRECAYIDKQPKKQRIAGLIIITFIFFIGISVVFNSVTDIVSGPVEVSATLEAVYVKYKNLEYSLEFRTNSGKTLNLYVTYAQYSDIEDYLYEDKIYYVTYWENTSILNSLK